jgi:hypothetical protein
MESRFTLRGVERAAEKLGSGYGLVGLQPTDDNHREPRCPAHRPRFGDLAKNRIGNVRRASPKGVHHWELMRTFLLI